MKKSILFTTMLAAMVSPIATVIACKNEKDYKIKSKWDIAPKYKGEKDANSVIGTVVSDPENPRWQKTKEFFEKNGKNIFTKNILSSIRKKATEQIEWIKTNVNKLNALIIGASDSSVAGTWSAFTASKPVVAFDRLVKTTNRKAYNWYVTYDNSLVGRIQAIVILNKLYNKSWTTSDSDKKILDYITKNKLKSKKIILALAGDPADNNAKLFYDGAMDLFKKVVNTDSNFEVPKEFQDFKNVAQARWDYSKGKTYLQSKISAMGDAKKKLIAAVLSPNDGMATSAINAIKQNGLDPLKIYITGQDANDSAILSIAGKKNAGQDMTISKPDSLATAIALALIKKILENPSDYNVGPTVLTASNKKTILDFIKASYPDISVTYDGEQYKTDSDKPINTLLLTPKAIDKDEIGTGKLFEVKK